MCNRAISMSVLLSFLVCACCSADWLVLRGGKKIETAGQWAVKGDLLTVREAGRPKIVTLSVVDYDATRQANAAAAAARRTAARSAAGSPAGMNPADDPHAAHIDAATVTRLEQYAQRQAQWAKQQRARSDAKMFQDAVERPAGRYGRRAPGQEATRDVLLVFIFE
jgi:hypothetical protein